MQKVALDSIEMKQDLHSFGQCIQDIFGPHGIAAMFQPVPGGHVTVTCQSQKIFQMLKTDNAVVRMMLASLQAFSRRCSESGLYAALLASQLISHGIDLELPRHKVAMVIGHTLSLVTDYLRSKHCCCRNDLELSSAQQMMSLVRSCLCSKCAVCSLNASEVDHLASLLLQGFLQVIPSSSDEDSLDLKDKLHFICSVGQSVSHSRLIPGLLVACEYPVTQDLLQDRAHDQIIRTTEGLIVTALFDVSMAGDLAEDFPEGVGLSSDSGNIDERTVVEEAVVQQMMDLAATLVEQGVGFVGCQKCVHPLIKDFFREKNVVVVDRLSALRIGAVKDVTGGELISSFTLDFAPEWLGKLKSIKPFCFQKQRYIVLKGDSAHSTLLLCCKSDTVADELKPLCSKIISTLQLSLHHPYVLYGGGCTETIINGYLHKIAAGEIDNATLQELKCNKKLYVRTVRCVADCFARVACSLEHYGGMTLSDSAFHHCWSFPPHQYCEATSQTGSGDLTFHGKTCNCGAVTLNDLPPGCKWCHVPDTDDGTINVIPDMIVGLLETDSIGALEGKHYKNSTPFPIVCDPYQPKVEAIELASDLATSILQIAYVVQEGAATGQQ